MLYSGARERIRDSGDIGGRQCVIGDISEEILMLLQLCGVHQVLGQVPYIQRAMLCAHNDRATINVHTGMQVSGWGQRLW